MKRHIILGLMFVNFLILSLYHPALGQISYPTKPIDVIVPWAAGGGTDICVRIIAKYVSQSNGIPINIINKPGAGGVIAIREVLMTARPDGYTMLGEAHGGSSMLGAFHEAGSIPFDWKKRTWIAMTDKDPVFYLVKQDAPWKTLKEVGEFAKNNPEKFRWGTSGRGGIGIPALVQFFRAHNVPIEKVLPNQVLSRGGSETPTQLAGGHIDFCAQQWGESGGLIEGKKIRALAVVSENRLKRLPDVPTVAEAGYPTFDVIGWHGISGPPGLPKHVVDFWTSSLEKGIKDPMYIEMFERVGKIAVYLGPKQVEEFVEIEYQKYLEISKYLGWRK